MLNRVEADRRQSFVQSVHRFVSERVHNAEVNPDPFPHLYIDGIFPSGFYGELIRNLPADDAYIPNEKYPSRLLMQLDANKARALGDFWIDFEAWVNGQEFLDVMVKKFGRFLDEVHSYRSEQIEMSAIGDNIRIGAHTQLARDNGDFTMGPHSDKPGKFITGLFYLSTDDRFAQFGTSIYRPKEPRFRSWKSFHFPHDNFELVRTFPNVPNAFLAFVKSDRSFHGVHPGAYSNDGRNLMMWVPEVGMSERASKQLLLPKSLF